MVAAAAARRARRRSLRWMRAKTHARMQHSMTKAATATGMRKMPHSWGKGFGYQGASSGRGTTPWIKPTWVNSCQTRAEGTCANSDASSSCRAWSAPRDSDPPRSVPPARRTSTDATCHVPKAPTRSQTKYVHRTATSPADHPPACCSVCPCQTERRRRRLGCYGRWGAEQHAAAPTPFRLRWPLPHRYRGNRLEGLAEG